MSLLQCKRVDVTMNATMRIERRILIPTTSGRTSTQSQRRRGGRNLCRMLCFVSLFHPIVASNNSSIRQLQQQSPNIEGNSWRVMYRSLGMLQAAGAVVRCMKQIPALVMTRTPDPKQLSVHHSTSTSIIEVTRYNSFRYSALASC